MLPDRHAAWLTKQQTADALGCSFKTIEELAKKGLLRAAMRRNEHTNVKARVYHPDDVKREWDKRHADEPDSHFGETPARLEATTARFGETQALVGETKPGAEETLRRLTDVLQIAAHPLYTTAEKPESKRVVRLVGKPYVTIDEAAELTGLPAGYLRRLIKARTLRAVKTPGWRIPLADLEMLEPK
jgi:excisionase family DNA binding protein